MNYYICLTTEEINHVSTYITIQKIWKTLKAIHKGTSKVKKVKLTILINNYRYFQMKDRESTHNMLLRFTDLVNKAHVSWKEFNKEELIREVLHSLASD